MGRQPPERRAPNSAPARLRALAAHVAELRACRLCPRVVPPPVTALPAFTPRMILVGQAPGPREVEAGRPFHFTAGGRLFGWFAACGVSEEEFRRRVYIAATIRCFPGRSPLGGDRVPAADELERCAPYLERELDLLRPLTVIAVGQIAIGRFLPPAPLAARVGQLFVVRRGRWPIEVIPLPHPSGRSTWINATAHRALLDRALELLTASRGWRATFPLRRAE